MSYQNYEGGAVFESFIRVFLHMYGIEISLQPYEIFPALQEKGIDAVVTSPAQLAGKTLQVKMFKNTFKYGTFPWEVSRFLTEKNTHVEEPHEAHFHFIVDPQEADDGLTEIKMLIFKTPVSLVKRYRNTWSFLEQRNTLPPMNRDLNEEEKKYWVEEGQVEKGFKLLENKDIYQLKLPYTAYQRNVRCRWRTIIPHRLETSCLLQSKFLKDISKMDNLTKAELEKMQTDIISDKLNQYFALYAVNTK